MDAATLKLAKNYTNEQVIQKATNSPVEEISFDGGIYSVGNNVVNGQVSVALKGRSLKNELNYNRETWAEWTAGNATKDISGLTLLADGVSYASAYINIALKTSTKYGVLLEYVSKSTVNKSLIFDPNSWIGGDNRSVTTLGNNKVVFTTPSIIAQQRFQFFYDIDTAGGHCKVRDIRLFELPAGSDIESDFTNLTADQLAQKYPYINGDSTKSTNSVRIRSVNEDETKESIVNVNLPEPLRSLPNGVKDEVNVTTGVKTQRNNGKILEASDVLSMYTTRGDGYDYAIVQVPTGYIPTDISKTVSISGYTLWSYTSPLGQVGVQFPAGTTLAQARTALVGLTLTYQLATPIVTKLPAQAPLQVFENGTVYVEPLGDPAETTLPSVELTAPIAGGNKVGIATHDYAGAAADWTLTSNESKCKSLLVTNAGGAANIIAPDKPGLTFTINNKSGQAITIKKSGGTGVTVTAGKKVTVQHFGTDYEAISSEI